MVRSSGLRQGPRNFDFRFSIILKKKNLVALTARELNFDEFKLGGLDEKHAVATWNRRSWSSLYNLGKDRTENTAPNSPSIACMSGA
jgi:hypothetical protein